MRSILWSVFDGITAGAMGGVVGLRLAWNDWPMFDAIVIGEIVAMITIVLIFAARIYAREFSK